MPNLIHYERLVIGYHGCDRSVGEAVLLNGVHLKASANSYDWLGQGVYFWEHGPARALEWAEGMKTRGKISEPFVLGAFIHLGRCFDLTDTSATSALQQWYEELRLLIEAAGQPLPKNKKLKDGDNDLLLRYLDCAVLNSGLQNFDQQVDGTYYQTVRGVFTEGAPAFSGSRIMSKTHVQIAVRDTDCILGYFRPVS